MHATRIVKLLSRFIALLLMVFVTGVEARPLAVLDSSANSRILKIDSDSGQVLSTLVPSGSGGLGWATDMLLGPDGNLYVSDFGNAVRRYDATTGSFKDVFTSGGPSGSIRSLAFSPAGDLLASQYNSPTILRYSGSTGQYLGEFANVPGVIDFGSLVYGPNSKLYASSFYVDNHTVYSYVAEFDAITGMQLRHLGTDVYIFTMSFGPDGDLYLGSGSDYSIHKFDPVSGADLGKFTSRTNGFDPRSILFDGAGSMYVSFSDSIRGGIIWRFSSDTGKLIGPVVGEGNDTISLL